MPRQTKDLALKTLADANARGFAPGAAQAHMILAWSECYLGNPAAAVEHSSLGRLQADAAGLAFVRGYLLMMAAQAELILGHLDESWQHIQELLEAGRRLSAPGMLFQARFAEGLLYLALGEFASAGESFHLAFSGRPSPYEHLSLEFSLAVAKAGLGQADAAMQELEAIAGQARQADLGYVFLPAGVAQAWLWAGHGQANKALQLLDQLEPELEQRDQRLLGVFGRLARAQAALGGNRVEDAMLICFQAGDAARMAGFPWGELLAYRMLVRAGDEAVPNLRPRVGRLLDEMRRHARLPQLAPLFERFCRSLLNPEN